LHLRCITLTVAQLRRIPEKERALLVVLGHAVNEVNTLDKLAYLSALALDQPRWQAQATAAQTFTLARVLVGKLNEGWEAIQAGYFKTRLSQTYARLADAEALAALGRLKKYFGRKNLLKTAFGMSSRSTTR